MKAKDRIGTVINGWKITRITGKRKNGQTLFEAISTITGKVIINASIYPILRNCYSHSNGYSHPRHFWNNQRLQNIFYAMKQRCYNIKSKAYNSYGRCGITIYQEWLDNPQAFEEWALEHGYQDNLTIDRINPNDNYEPSNCRWISNQENAKWTRNTQHIWIKNYVDSARGWSLKIGEHEAWFRDSKRRHGFNYAYQRLLKEIEKLGGIKKVVGVD